MISYSRQFIDKGDMKAVSNVLKSKWLTQGPKVLEFEKILANYCGVKYAVAVSNGTAALHLAYLAAGLGKGDEAITSPNTFVATTNMLLAVGARPVFCDIRLDSYNLDEKKIEKLINSKTKVIVPVDFAGQPCELEEIKKIAKKKKLIVIEDACHALGGKYRGKKIGSLADMTIFSFHPVKAITTGEGGAILTNNKKYYEKLILMRSHGVYKNSQRKNVMKELGYNYRLTDIQAALGISQMKKIGSFIKKRRQIAVWYREELSGINEIILPVELPENYSGWHLYVIRTRKPTSRDRLAKYLSQRGIGVNFHYPAVYSHPYYQKAGYQNFKLANMEEYQKTCLVLPCHQQLKRGQIKYIAELIKDFFKK
jgi:UDP-4-amino-4,6-dideoxy-N-acetyl-beta-L-altrosamine transaminase